MKVAVVGIGLIGGSLAIDLKRRGFAQEIIAVESDIRHANIAKLAGLADTVDTLEGAIDRSDLLLVCTPVNAIETLLPIILDKIGNREKFVIDMGSTKSTIARSVLNHPNRSKYVAAHPMAGTEYSGPMAAVGKLFDYKHLILCDIELSGKKEVEKSLEMFKLLNMKVSYMDSASHDLHVAYVSHISHITSFSLALSVLEKEKDDSNILMLAAGGFESTVRLAKSASQTWAPIFVKNSDYISQVLDTYIDNIQLFKKYINEGNEDELILLIEKANEIKKILN